MLKYVLKEKCIDFNKYTQNKETGRMMYCWETSKIFTDYDTLFETQQ